MSIVLTKKLLSITLLHLGLETTHLMQDVTQKKH
jgi:hypothetical protein